jgi:CDP-glucose 4,6-dehydratase
VKSIKAILNITSDKCYENKELSQSYRENDALGGFDPYSSSKACSEILTGCYRRSFFESQNVAVASARAGNVIGGGDWAKDRLIPDIIRSVLRGDDVELRYPESVRPWQHVIQPLHGYLLLVEKMFENPERYSSAWNFGPNIHDCRSAKWIAENLLAILNSSLKIIEKKEKTHHESRMLIIDSTKSRTELSWKPAWDIRKSLLMTGDWYIKSRAIENNLEELCLSQIESYARDVENGE